MTSFLVPDDFRAFMKLVVGELAQPNHRVLDAEDAFQDECGYGGRIDGGETYRFVYLTRDGQHRWEVVLHEAEIQAIADGLQIEANGERREVVRTHDREPHGYPLLVWGAYNDDALTVHTQTDLIAALETLRQYATDKPRVVRVWSPYDDQLIAVIWNDVCALYVVESIDGYATSSGDPSRTDAFEVTDHDGKSLTVPWHDCVPWAAAAPALMRFAMQGELGSAVTVEGRIPSQLLMLGEIDRKTLLAIRKEPARDPSRSSLPRLTPLPIPAVVEPATETTNRTDVEIVPITDHGAWSRRLIQTLFERELIELGDTPGLDEVSYQLGGLLQAHGMEAEHSLETAEWLANELGAIRGVSRLFATPGDLQVALRRSRAEI